MVAVAVAVIQVDRKKRRYKPVHVSKRPDS
jgi:hypothetical protein